MVCETFRHQIHAGPLLLNKIADDAHPERRDDSARSTVIGAHGRAGVTFHIYDYVLQTNIAFPELHRAQTGRAAVTLRLDSRRPRQPVEPSRWRPYWTLPGGRPWLLAAETSDAHLLRFPRIVDFVIRRDRLDVVSYARPKTPRDTLRHLWLDQVLPLAMSAVGRIVLHASAVSTLEGAVAFLGKAGVGKSTVAAGVSRDVGRLLADDALLIERRGTDLVAVPSYPGVRLWPATVSRLSGRMAGARQVAHYTDKKRIAADALGMRQQNRRQPLRRVYVLRRAAADRRPRVTPLSSRDAVMTLIQHSYCLEHRNPHRVAWLLDQWTRDMRLTTVKQLVVPRDLNKLGQVGDVLMEDLRR